LVAAAGMLVIGFQSVMFWLFTRVYARSEGFLPESPRAAKVLAMLSLERVLVLGGLVSLGGLVGLIYSLAGWQASGFGRLDYEHAIRVVTVSVTALMLGCQAIIGCFFLSILGIKQTKRASTDVTVAKAESSDERSIVAVSG
jgi:hypothetical protein